MSLCDSSYDCCCSSRDVAPMRACLWSRDHCAKGSRSAAYGAGSCHGGSGYLPIAVVVVVIIAGFTAAVVAAPVAFVVVGATIPIAHVVRCAVTRLKVSRERDRDLLLLRLKSFLLKWIDWE